MSDLRANTRTRECLVYGLIRHKQHINCRVSLKLDSLGQRKIFAVINCAGGTPHVLLP